MASLVTTRPGFPRLNRLLIVATFLAVLAVAVLASALVYQVAMAGTTSANAAQIVFQTAQVTRGTVTRTVNGVGPITPAAGVPLSFKSSGRLAAINVEVGQRFEAGQEFARLDTAELQAAERGLESANKSSAQTVKAAQAPPASTGQPVDAGRTGRIVHALVLADGEPSLRQILVGTSDENNTQVISGLEPGEQVIVGQIVTGPGQNPTQTK